MLFSGQVAAEGTAAEETQMKVPMINGNPVKDGCIHTALAVAAEEFAAAGIE